MNVPAQIDAHLPQLTPAERKVAAVVVDDPEAVAFGTVAGIARRAGSSGATVVRLGTKLGYDGFAGLQAAVRAEMTRRLRPASERIRRGPATLGATDTLARALACELANVAGTLEAVTKEGLAAAVGMLAGLGAAGRRAGAASGTGGSQRLFVLSGDASAGVAALLAGELALLRPGVELVQGSAVRVEAALAAAQRGDVMVVLDLSRYDREVVEATVRAVARGMRVVAVTDSALSPIAEVAEVSFTVLDGGVGPFDSHVGALALTNALTAALASRLRRHAVSRLDRVEGAWREAGALLDT